MKALVKDLKNEMKNRLESGREDVRIPMRPDHGIKTGDDYQIATNPGYPIFGRLKGLREIEEAEQSQP